MKKVGYKAAPANQNKGNKTHGSFKNDGQKPGRKAPAGKEKQPADTATFLKKFVSEARRQKARKQAAGTTTGIGVYQ